MTTMKKKRKNGNQKQARVRGNRVRISSCRAALPQLDGWQTFRLVWRDRGKNRLLSRKRREETSFLLFYYSLFFSSILEGRCFNPNVTHIRTREDDDGNFILSDSTRRCRRLLVFVLPGSFLSSVSKEEATKKVNKKVNGWWFVSLLWREHDLWRYRNNLTIASFYQSSIMRVLSSVCTFEQFSLLEANSCIWHLTTSVSCKKVGEIKGTFNLSKLLSTCWVVVWMRMISSCWFYEPLTLESWKAEDPEKLDSDKRSSTIPHYDRFFQPISSNTFDQLIPMHSGPLARHDVIAGSILTPSDSKTDSFLPNYNECRNINFSFSAVFFLCNHFFTTSLLLSLST